MRTDGMTHSDERVGFSDDLLDVGASSADESTHHCIGHGDVVVAPLLVCCGQ